MIMGSLEELRERAEGMLSSRPAPALAGIHDETMLAYELEVHQVELQMQNDELRRAHIELEKSHNRYFELYDLAPVGYVTLGTNGKIVEANRAAAKLLGSERRVLLGRPLSAFMTARDADRFHIFRRTILSSEATRHCDLSLVRKDGQTIPVHLHASAIEDGSVRPSCRCMIIAQSASEIVSSAQK